MLYIDNFIATQKNDGIIHCRRWGCAECKCCRSGKWLECTRQYICGVFSDAKLKIEVPKSKGTKRKRHEEDTDGEPKYKRLVDGKFLCLICPNAKPIKSTSSPGHVRAKQHQSNLK